MTELQVQGQEALGLIRVQNQLTYLRDMLCDQHPNAPRNPTGKIWSSCIHKSSESLQSDKLTITSRVLSLTPAPINH